MIEENIAVIEKNAGLKVGGVIGKIDDFTNPPRHCYGPLEIIFTTLFPGGLPRRFHVRKGGERPPECLEIRIHAAMTAGNPDQPGSGN